jgi:hypothetical protein
MIAGLLTNDDVGKMISIGDRAGILKRIGRRASLVSGETWVTIHLEVFRGNSVFFVRIGDEVMVES